MNKDIVRAQLEIELPSDKWVYSLSKEFTDLTINILSMSLIRENACNILVNLTGREIKQILPRLKEHNSVIEYIEVSKSPNSILLNVKVRNPWLLLSSIESEVVVKYPIKIQNGMAHWEIYSTRDKINKLFQNLQKLGIKIELKSIGKPKEKSLLTPRQEEILRIAINEGYYEVPRKIQLADLAKKINISTSTLSESIRKINQKLVNLV